MRKEKRSDEAAVEAARKSERPWWERMHEPPSGGQEGNGVPAGDQKFAGMSMTRDEVGRLAEQNPKAI